MMTYAYRGEIAGRPLATSCKILVTIAKFSVALATRKAQFQTLWEYVYTVDQSLFLVL